ncbi:MAG: BsuBI/PstI family type II restriction endonuclease [Candidatus Cloacimonadaceae bacterium]
MDQESTTLIENLETQTIREFNKSRPSLAGKHAKPRELVRIPVKYTEHGILLSPGEHKELIMSIIENFASAFLHGAELLYVGDTQSFVLTQKRPRWFQNNLAGKRLQCDPSQRAEARKAVLRLKPSTCCFDFRPIPVLTFIFDLAT